MVHALVVPTRIFKVRKFLVNGKPEYYSPDKNAPIIETDPQDESSLKASEFELFDVLGGGKLEVSIHGFKCYRVEDGSIIHIKRSKYYERHENYWYGLRPNVLDLCKQYKVTHIIFIMGNEGFVKVPINIVDEFLKNTKATYNEDGTVRHYHCLITPGPDPELYWSQEMPRFDLKQYYQTF